MKALHAGGLPRARRRCVVVLPPPLHQRFRSHALGIPRAATELVRLAITAMVSASCEEVVLETEADNEQALGFYRKLGFIKEKRLYRFYLNAKDAYRLVLPLPHFVTDAVPRGRARGRGEGEGEARTEQEGARGYEASREGRAKGMIV